MENNDILFLTEVCGKAKTTLENRWLKSLSTELYIYNIRRIGKTEYMIAVVSKDKFDTIAFLDDNDELPVDSRISTIGISTVLKDNRKEFVIKGVRLQTICTGREFKNQTGMFVSDVIDSKPDIIIGDFNWSTTIGKYINKILGSGERKKENIEHSKKILRKILGDKELVIPKEYSGEDKLCTLINHVIDDDTVEYGIWPHTDSGIFSAKTRNHNTYILSNPDRVMWNTKAVSGIKKTYSPLLFDGNTDFFNDWPSDHSILKFMFSISG